MRRNHRLPPSRRDWLRLCSAGVAGLTASGWMAPLSRAAADTPRRNKACILLWMNGGPSQMDTFDLKPGHQNGGPFQETDTNVPGVRISEHLPNVAKHADKLAIVRSMSTKEADHGRGAYLMHTGRPPGGPIRYPTLGSFISKELVAPDADLPGFVSVSPYRFLSPEAYGSGFLGPKYAPLIVGENGGVVPNPGAQPDYADALKVKDLDRPTDIPRSRAEARIDMLREAEAEFMEARGHGAAKSHDTAYRRALRLMGSEAVKAFDLEEESDKLRDAYGRNLFGQGCLLARRLVEQGVPFVEVTLSQAEGVQGLGWDTHQNNFDSVKALSNVLDPAWATLMADLEDRGLLDTTLVLWMGEFGRTPKINGNTGRDHWAKSWSTVMAGGGIKGGQVVGKTDEGGVEVTDRPVSVGELMATTCVALGLDPAKQNDSDIGRPIRLVDLDFEPIEEVL